MNSLDRCFRDLAELVSLALSPNTRDNSLVLLGSGIGNPNIHDHSNLPILVAGGGAGKLQGGRHITFAQQTPLSNLLLTMLDKADVRVDRFADSSGRVHELLEDPLSL